MSAAASTCCLPIGQCDITGGDYRCSVNCLLEFLSLRSLVSPSPPHPLVAQNCNADYALTQDLILVYTAINHKRVMKLLFLPIILYIYLYIRKRGGIVRGKLCCAVENLSISVFVCILYVYFTGKCVFHKESSKTE